MRPQAKKLIYIVNYLDASDVQHFVHIVELLKQLKALGWSVLLLSERGGHGTGNVMGLEVRYLSGSNRFVRVIAMIAALTRARTQGYRLSFVRISKVAALVSGIAGRLIGIKTLYWQSGAVHDFDWKKPVVRRTLDRLQERAIVALVHRFVTGPETMLDYYEKALSVPRAKLMLLYNDVDQSRFNSSDRPPEAGPLQVLVVHRFSPVRQTDLYFPALIARLSELSATRPLRLVMVGEGPELPLLQSQAEAAAETLEVSFVGPVPNRDIQHYYARSHVFLMPSYREGFPRVIIEAMAMGLPIVTTDAGGTRDLLGPVQADYIIPRDEPGRLAERLVEMLGSPEAREAARRENLERAPRYSTPVIARMYDRALRELL